MTTRSQPVDRHVGQRLRLARRMKGLSQTALGEAVGLTFQQIQKYEKGVNRISASRLFQFAEVLGIDVPFFFHGTEQQHVADGVVGAQAGAGSDRPRPTQLDIEIMEKLSEMRDPTLKRMICDLIAYVGTAGAFGAESASAGVGFQPRGAGGAHPMWEELF